MKAEDRHLAKRARTRATVAATACTECPVCGSEECLLLEELGNYCATMMAASLARAGSAEKSEKAEKPKRAGKPVEHLA